MKKILTVALAILIIVIAGCAGVAMWRYAIPWLDAKSTWEQDYPTIKQMEQEIAQRNVEIDSLTNKVERLEQKIEMQERIISERDIQSKISSQLHKLQTTYERSQSDNK